MIIINIVICSPKKQFFCVHVNYQVITGKLDEQTVGKDVKRYK